MENLTIKPTSVSSTAVQSLSQAAEIIALTRACELTKGKRATIYTDSKYSYGVVQDFTQTWARRNFQTSEGKPISHVGLVD